MWLILSLITALGFGVGQVIAKKGLSDLPRSVVYTINGLCFTFVLLAYLLINGGLEWNFWAFLISALPGVAYGYTLTAYLKAEVGKVATVGALSAVVSTLVARGLIGEELSYLQISFILMTIVGVMIVSWPGKKVKDFSWFKWGLGYALIYGVVNVMTKKGMALVNPVSYSLMDAWWVLLISIIWLYKEKSGKQLILSFSKTGGKILVGGLTIFNLGGMALFLALNTGMVGAVMGVMNLNVVIVIGLSGWWLKEKMSARQLLGAWIVVLGVVGLSLLG